MGEELLVNEQIDAGADFIRDFNDYAPVSVACWIVPADSDRLYLYVAADNIDRNDIPAAYGEVAQMFGGKWSGWLDPFQIKLIASSDPIARDAIQFRDLYPAQPITRYRGTSIGGMGIDNAYIYPPVSALKATP